MNDYVHEVSDSEAARIQRFLYGVAIGTIVVVLLIIVAIATAQHWVKLVSHESERQFMSPHVSWVNEHLLDSGDPVLQSYVQQLGGEIAAVMDLPPSLQLDFFVIEGSTVKVTLMGACRGCAMANSTLADFVAERIKLYAPEITDVVAE